MLRFTYHLSFGEVDVYKRQTQDHPRGIGGQTACQQNLANAYAEGDAQILRGGHGVTCYRDHTVAVTFAVRHRPV